MPTPPIKATTQEHLEILDIINNIILLKDGSAALILSINAVNFGLLSEEEQDAIIYAYASLLNSLTYPVQILIRSQKKDITDYVKLLKTQEQSQNNSTLKKRITQYRLFVETMVKERNVLDKKFYVIIPFSRFDLGFTTNSVNPLANKPQPTKLDKNYVLQKALNTLEPRRDHILRQFARIGLVAKQLSTQQLIQLLYTVYNPDSSEGIQTITTQQYQSPIVQSNKPVLNQS